MHYLHSEKLDVLLEPKQPVEMVRTENDLKPWLEILKGSWVVSIPI